MTTPHGHGPSENQGLFDKPETGRRVHNWLAIICLALFAADVLAANDVLYHQHVHFDFEHIPGFYGAVGFCSYVGLVQVAKLLRKVVKRDPRYYEDPRFHGGGRDA